MPAGIRQEARRLGGQFSLEAAQALASHTGNQTRLASQEITKLLTYVDYRRTVEAEEVEELVTSGGQADIFQLVDSAAQGNASQALKHLHRLLDTQEPAYIYTMLVRQFRLLVLARECVEDHLTQVDHAANALHQPRFVVEKALNQCRRFSTPQLDAIYRRLLAIDVEVKTSQIPIVLALDTFIASLGR
jgi:DNA polymerase-3 subunit delta